MKIVDRRNRQKHLSRNPLQRWLVRRFHARVAGLTREALAICADPPLAAGPGESPLATGDTRPWRVDGSSEGVRPAVLEVGCGEGFVLASLARHLPAARYHGADYDAGAVHEAAQRNPGFPLCAADAVALPFAARSFPVVLCLEVLEHLADPVAALAELKRVSAAFLVLSVPNQPFFALSNGLRGKNWRTLGDDPEHVHHWTGSQFVELVRAHLQITRVVYSFPWVLVLARSPQAPRSPDMSRHGDRGERIRT